MLFVLHVGTVVGFILCLVARSLFEAGKLNAGALTLALGALLILTDATVRWVVR